MSAFKKNILIPSKSFLNQGVSKLTLAAISMTFLSACTLQSQSTADKIKNSATFGLSQSEASFTTVKTQALFSIPTSRTLNLKACLKDNQYSKALISQAFDIGGGPQSLAANTDTNGCLHWSEDIQYDHLKDAALLTISRTITGKGIQKGSLQVEFAIDPWEGQAFSLFEKTFAELLNSEQTQLHMKSTQEKNLSLPDGRVSVERVNNTSAMTGLNINLKGEIKVSLKNRKKEQYFYTLNSGKIQARLSLIHVQKTNENESQKILSQSSTLVGQMIDNGAISLQALMQVQNMCTLGQIYLKAELIPEGGPDALKGSSNMYLLGDCDSVIGSHFVRLKNNQAQTISETKIEQIANPIIPSPNSTMGLKPENEKVSDGYINSKIQISALETHNVGFERKNTLLHVRTYNFNLCFTTAWDHKTLRAQTFEITTLSGQKIPPKSFTNGCISWDDSIEFNYFDKECWKKGEIKVVQKELGLSESIPLEFNPMSENESQIRDMRPLFKGQIAKEQQLKCADGHSEIMTNRIDFDKGRFDYAIDKALNIEVIKVGNLRLNLSLVRPSLTEVTGFADRRAPVGEYLLRYAIVDATVAQFDDPKKAEGLIYSVGEKIIKVQGNSSVMEEFNFATKNIKSMASTNFLLFEIEPIGSVPEKHQTSVVTNTFKVPVILSNNNEGGNAVIASKKGVLKGLLAQFNKDQEKLKALNDKTSTKDFFAADNNLELINLNQPQQAQELLASLVNPNAWRRKSLVEMKAYVTFEDLKAWLDSGVLKPEAAQRFCGHWYYNILSRNLPGKDFSAIDSFTGFAQDTLLSKCRFETMKDIRKHFDVEFRYFVKNPKLVEVKDGYYRDLQINQAFTLARNFNNNYAKSMSWDIGGGVKLPEIPGLSFFSASTGVRYQVSKAQNDTRSWGNSMAVTAGVTSIIETLTAKIRSEDYEKCLVIKLNPNLYVGDSKLAKSLSAKLTADEKTSILRKGYMLCQGQLNKKALDFNENYYVINQRPGQTSMIDMAGENTRPFFMALRGRGDLSSFLSYIHESHQVPNSYMGDFQQSHILNDPTQAAFMRNIKSYPGQLVAPR